MQPIPDKVVLDLERKKLFIDDVEFPWAIADEPRTRVLCAADDLPRCTVTFFAESIEAVPYKIAKVAE